MHRFLQRSSLSHNCCAEKEGELINELATRPQISLTDGGGWPNSSFAKESSGILTLLRYLLLTRGLCHIISGREGSLTVSTSCDLSGE